MILSAALQVTFQRPDEEETITVAGHRHMDIYYLLSAFHVPTVGNPVEGFMDHEGNFLDRYEAFEHAVNCGQLSWTTIDHKERHCELQLFSEDLY